MFTLVAYRNATMTGGIWEYLTPVPDQHVRVEGYNIIVPPDMANLAGVMFIGDEIAAGRVESPALRRTVLYDVVPLAVATYPTDGWTFADLFYTPIPLDPAEPLRMVGFNDVGEPDPVTALVWLADGPQAPAVGTVYTVACDDVSYTGTGAWESYALTFSQTLPAGTYQCVGGYVWGALLYAWRLIFVGQAWRPGAYALPGIFNYQASVFRRGGLGVWGEFTHDQPPVLDVLAAGAGTAHIYLDLVKVG